MKSSTLNSVVLLLALCAVCCTEAGLYVQRGASYPFPRPLNPPAIPPFPAIPAIPAMPAMPAMPAIPAIPAVSSFQPRITNRYVVIRLAAFNEIKIQRIGFRLVAPSALSMESGGRYQQVSSRWPSRASPAPKIRAEGTSGNRPKRSQLRFGLRPWPWRHLADNLPLPSPLPSRVRAAHFADSLDDPLCC